MHKNKTVGSRPSLGSGRIPCASALRVSFSFVASISRSPFALWGSSPEILPPGPQLSGQDMSLSPVRTATPRSAPQLRSIQRGTPVSPDVTSSRGVGLLSVCSHLQALRSLHFPKAAKTQGSWLPPPPPPPWRGPGLLSPGFKS